MKTTCWKLFSFLSIDREAAQDWLNDMAQQGWELTHIYLGLFARFLRTERTDLTYSLDWASALEEAEYLRLCADAGWTLVQPIGYLNLYATQPGTQPVPIQTDPEGDFLRFRKKTLRSAAFSIVFLLLVLAVAAWAMLTLTSPAQLAAYLLCAYSVLPFLGVTLLPALVLWALYLFQVARFIRRWRQALQDGEPLSHGTPAQVRRRGLLRVADRGYLALCFLFFLVDVLFNRVFSLPSALTLLVVYLVMFLGSKRDDPARHRLARTQLLSFVLPLLVCILLSYPLQTLLPRRAPPFPVPTQEESFSQRDSLLGSHLRWSWYDDSVGEGPKDYFHWQADCYLWASPGLGNVLSPDFAQSPQPVEGYPGLYDVGQGRYLYCQDNAQLVLTGSTRQEWHREFERMIARFR